MTAAAADAAAGADGLSPTSCQAAGGLTADLEMAEAAAAAEQASAAVKASRAAHKEALTAAAQVGPCCCLLIHTETRLLGLVTAWKC